MHTWSYSWRVHATGLKSQITQHQHECAYPPHSYDEISANVQAGVATGEEEDDSKDEMSSAAAQMGRKGGKARAEKLTKEQRSEIAKKAAAKRWKTSREE